MHRTRLFAPRAREMGGRETPAVNLASDDYRAGGCARTDLPPDLGLPSFVCVVNLQQRNAEQRR